MFNNTTVNQEIEKQKYIKWSLFSLANKNNSFRQLSPHSAPSVLYDATSPTRKKKNN